MYSKHRYEVPLTTGTATLDLTSTGDKARWSPMFVPHIIRAVAVASNATPGDAGVLKGDIRPTFSSDTNRTDGTAFVINIATTHVQGKIIFKDGLSVQIDPGQELVVEMTDASASLNAAKVSLWVEAVYENPLNITPMVETT